MAAETRTILGEPLQTDVNKLLIDAITEENINKVEELIKVTTDINQSDKNGKTPIYYAIKSKNWEIMKFLIKHGADLEIPGSIDIDVLRPLMHEDIEMFTLLLKHGADVNVSTNELLREAILLKNAVIVQMLIDRNTNYDPNEHLSNAIQQNSVEILEILIRDGADVNSKPFINEAINLENKGVLECLLDYGAKFDLKEVEALEEDRSILFRIGPHYIILNNTLFGTGGEPCILLTHLIKQKALDLPIGDENSRRLDTYRDLRFEECRADCEMEVTQMKNRIIHSNSRISVCDILTGSLQEVRKYLRNEDLKHELFEIDIWTDYPNFSNMLSRRIDLCLEKNVLFNKNYELLSKILNAVKVLPDACVLEIQSYFTERDMKNLLISFNLYNKSYQENYN